jgi:hypothetical protein
MILRTTVLPQLSQFPAAHLDRSEEKGCFEFDVLSLAAI